jgi:hypothetical protein
MYVRSAVISEINTVTNLRKQLHIRQERTAQEITAITLSLRER